MSRPLRIGFAGSATNPSHLGHEKVLELILSCGLFDRVFWFPSGWSKEKPNLIDGIYRQQLANLAFPREWITRPKSGWASLLLDSSATMAEDVPTYLRFQMLRKDHPDAQITFITGSDAVMKDQDGILPIHKWKEPKLLERENILIIPRTGFALPGQVHLPPNMEWLDTDPLPDVQSKKIRQMIRMGDERWRLMVNDDVLDFIDYYHLFHRD